MNVKYINSSLWSFGLQLHKSSKTEFSISFKVLFQILKGTISNKYQNSYNKYGYLSVRNGRK